MVVSMDAELSKDLAFSLRLEISFGVDHQVPQADTPWCGGRSMSDVDPRDMPNK